MRPKTFAPADAPWPQRTEALHENLNKNGVRLWTDCSFDEDREIGGGDARSARAAR